MPTLTWIGKDAMQQLHREAPHRLLRCDTRAVTATADDNLLVNGDRR